MELITWYFPEIVRVYAALILLYVQIVKLFFTVVLLSFFPCICQILWIKFYWSKAFNELFSYGIVSRQQKSVTTSFMYARVNFWLKIKFSYGRGVGILFHIKFYRPFFLVIRSNFFFKNYLQINRIASRMTFISLNVKEFP